VCARVASARWCPLVPFSRLGQILASWVGGWEEGRGVLANPPHEACSAHSRRRHTTLPKRLMRLPSTCLEYGAQRMALPLAQSMGGKASHLPPPPPCPFCLVLLQPPLPAFHVSCACARHPHSALPLASFQVVQENPAYAAASPYGAPAPAPAGPYAPAPAPGAYPPAPYPGTRSRSRATQARP
jgi:hypothetical protein